MQAIWYAISLRRVLACYCSFTNVPLLANVMDMHIWTEIFWRGSILKKDEARENDKFLPTWGLSSRLTVQRALLLSRGRTIVPFMPT